MKNSNKIILCICLLSTLIILVMITCAALKAKSDADKSLSTTDTELIDIKTTYYHGMMEISETPEKSTIKNTLSLDPRISFDNDGNVHIDVCKTNDNAQENEPHIIGKIVIIPDLEDDK